MLLEYIWIDGNGGLRSKTRVHEHETAKYDEFSYGVANRDVVSVFHEIQRKTSVDI